MKRKSLFLLISALLIVSADLAYLYAGRGGGGGGGRGGGGGFSRGGGGGFSRGGGSRGFSGGGARSAGTSRPAAASRPASSSRTAGAGKASTRSNATNRSAANRGNARSRANQGNRNGNRKRNVNRNGNFRRNGGWGRYGGYGYYGGFGWYGFWPAFGLGFFVYPWLLNGFYGYGDGGDTTTVNNYYTNNELPQDSYIDGSNSDNVPGVPDDAVFVSEEELDKNPTLKQYLQEHGLSAQGAPQGKTAAANKVSVPTNTDAAMKKARSAMAA